MNTSVVTETGSALGRELREARRMLREVTCANHELTGEVHDLTVERDALKAKVRMWIDHVAEVEHREGRSATALEELADEYVKLAKGWAQVGETTDNHFRGYREGTSMTYVLVANRLRTLVGGEDK